MRIRAVVCLVFLIIVLLAGPAAGASVPAVPRIDPDQCAPLSAPDGDIVNVSDEEGLWTAVNSAQPGDTILIADGTYHLGQNDYYVWIDTPGLTLRSASGDRDAVILDDAWSRSEIVTIAASNVTIADITIQRARTHPIHVISSDSGDTLNTLIYNVHIIDPGQQAIKINPSGSGYFTDNGTIACSHIELTDAGRLMIPLITTEHPCYNGGVDAHQSRGWVIRDNQIEGFWCESGLSEHGIHLWRGCRDTTIERNALNDNARGIGLGMAIDGQGRTYSDDPCPSAVGYVDDFGGVIRNNFISANDPDLFESEYGFDCGICLWNACNGQVLHNTVYTADPVNTFSSIEWRFANTQAVVSNNLVNHQMRERDYATAVQAGNLTDAAASWFVDPAQGDLHLLSSASQAIDQARASTAVSDDFDGDMRPISAASDIGADEYGDPPPAAVTDLRLTQVLTGTEMITITLTWSPPAGAESQAIRYASAPINSSTWDDAPLLNGDLDGSTTSFSASIPYTGGTLYFAHKGYNTDGGWSVLSNNASWPRFDIYLPLIK